MASPLVERTKLNDESVRRIVRGFAFGDSIAPIATDAGVSTKAAIQLILALRRRLFSPPFYRWKSPGPFFTTYDVPYQDAVERTIFGVLQLCYENKRCRSNYVQGRRVGRMCRGCPTSTIFEDYPTQQRAIAYCDTIAEFYQRLGIGGERGTDRTEVFMLRWTHTMVVLRAMAASGLVAPNVPSSGEGPLHDCDELHRTLIASLDEEPLRRTP